jgi:L,D-transpeptidase YcbB
MVIMPRLASKLVLGLAALAFATSAAEADSKYFFRRKANFFESLFGSRSYQPQRRTIYGDYSDGERQNWWEQTHSSDGTRSIYGDPYRKRLNRAPQEYAEPEPLPGLGMGIVTYQPPLVVPVYDVALGRLPASTPEAEAIRNLLSKSSTNIRTTDVERKAVLTFYKANGFKPLWTENSQISARASALLKLLSNADADGLMAKNYLPVILTSFENAQAITGDPEKLAQFDVGLTVQALKYAHHISGGQFDPARLSLYNDIKTQPVNADQALRVLAHSPYPDTYLISLAPTYPQYAIFKDRLSKMSGPGPAIEVVAGGATVKAGKTDPRISKIRAKLQTLGFLTADAAVNNNEELLDKALSGGLKAFQKANKIKQTGALDSATVQAFNTDHSGDERQRLIFNMERMRWLPKSLGNRYVFVNQAAFDVNVMDHGNSVWKSRVIVGRPMTQTASFYDQIETVVFNPTWGVPASIIVNEYGPKSRKDPGYLDSNGFKVINANGDLVSSRSINWWTFGQTPTFGVQQPAGDGNALGEIKFLFPNSHDIYMHDTPSRNLFTQSTRAFSHGCVRVQNPREFAAVLLGMNQATVAANVESGESHPVNLAQKVPVYLTYFTAWTDETGKIHYFDDIYGRDTAMAKAFAYGSEPKKPSNPIDIVADGTLGTDLTSN